MSAVFLPAHVVCIVYGQVVCQQAGSKTTGGVAERRGSLSHVQITVLCLGRAKSSTNYCAAVINL